MHKRLYKDSFSHVYQSTINWFFSAQENIGFIFVPGTVENVMKSWLIIKDATSKCRQSCKEFDSSMIFIVEDTFRSWFNEFQDINLKNFKF